MDGAAAHGTNPSDAEDPRPGAENGAIDNGSPNDIGEHGLSRREHDVLAFERQWWKYAGAKEEAIKELFGLSATRYYQVLNA